MTIKIKTNKNLNLGEVADNKAHGHGVILHKECKFGGLWDSGYEYIGKSVCFVDLQVGHRLGCQFNILMLAIPHSELLTFKILYQSSRLLLVDSK